MTDWETFFAMGGYAGFVWPAYVVSVTALVILIAQSWRAMKRAERLVDLSERAERK